MFSTSESKPHSTRKRMISNIYSKSYLQSSAALNKITSILVIERLLPQLHEMVEEAQLFDILPLISASTMDFVTSYLFGLSPSSDFLRNEKKRNDFLKNYTSRHAYNFYPQEVPRLTSFLKKFGIRLVPKWVDAANGQIEDWTLQMCDGAAKSDAGSKDSEQEDIPEVYRQLKSAMDKSYAKDTTLPQGKAPDQRIMISSELADHLAAGFDTSGITLAYFIHEISQRPDIQTALRTELRSLEHPIHYQPDIKASTLPSPKALDALPLLQATLQETLRLRSAIPGPQPRITPPTGCNLGPNLDYYIPPNTRISAQAHSLHRNPEVFQDPEEWRPERWLKSSEVQLKEMNRWFWAFGSGGRMCVGSNLAMYQMKYIIAALYTDYKTILVDDTGFEQRDLYTAPPTSGELIVRLEAIT
jgi:cytochrome P450